MKKRLRSACCRLLSAALLAGLMCTPAAAVPDLTLEDGIKPIAYQFLDADGQSADYPSVEESFHVGVNYVKSGTFNTYPVEGYYTIPADASLTLFNQGGVQDCYLTISVVSFEEMDKAQIEAKYARKIEKQNSLTPDEPVELEEELTYYVYSETDWGGKYLLDDGTWVNGASNPQNILKVEERGSHTFSLPDAVEGQMYRVDFQAHYPKSKKPDYYYFWRFYVKIDSQAQSGSESTEESGGQTEPQEPEQPAAFSDVAANAWYAKSVAWAVEQGVTSGTGSNTFSPKKTCTTAEILTFLWRAAGSPQPTTTDNPFSDVAEDAWYRTPALWAYEQGLVSGPQLSGDTPCTRANTMVFLWKLAGAPEMDAPAFSDVDPDADYAQAVAWAVQEGITSGTGEAAFSPEAICDRSQIVTFLYQNFGKTE
ncbi:S-layer homology domain-containing protein [Lawsonibacter sp. LCP25S3_G6]|uniref:S-layer homology domain-containing protein n=1 Tax=unclassified Lawsonibacter TaxID=2617946 RepID=UPI003F982273